MAKVKAHQAVGWVLKLIGAAASVAALYELKKKRDEQQDPVLEAAKVLTKQTQR